MSLLRDISSVNKCNQVNFRYSENLNVCEMRSPNDQKNSVYNILLCWENNIKEAESLNQQFFRLNKEV